MRLLLLVVFACVLVACSTYSPPPNIATPIPGLPTAPGPQAPPSHAATAKMDYLENANIKVGVDLARGGALTFLSYRGQPNMINVYDQGRYAQMSLWGGPVPFIPPGAEIMPGDGPRVWGWLVVTAGDGFDTQSKLVETRKTANEIYIKSIPQVFTLRNIPAECTFEYWVTLEANAVKVRFRAQLNRADLTQYEARGHEAPAVYATGNFTEYTTYYGTKPYANEPLLQKELPKAWPHYYHIPENWVALVNKSSDVALGLYAPYRFRTLVGTFNEPYGQGTATDPQTSLITGDDITILDPKAPYECQYTLIPGRIADIRAYVYAQPRPETRPNYRFANDRLRWRYDNTRDQGYPIKDGLAIDFAPKNLMIRSPLWQWVAAEVPKLYIQAAFTTTAKTARLSWRTFFEEDFPDLANQNIDFPITGDGVMRTYVIDMTKAPNWKGSIIQLGIRHSPNDPALAGQRLLLKSVTADAP